jgi:hypothetical protein
MNWINLKSIGIKEGLILVLVPLLLFCTGANVYYVVKHGWNLLGVIYFIYLVLPVSLFVVIYLFLLKKIDVSTIGVSYFIALFFILSLYSVWIFYIGNPVEYFGESYWKYWIRHLEKSWVLMTYFYLTIPLFLSYLSKRNM